MAEDEFRIQVHVDEHGVGRLEWGTATSVEVLTQAVSLAADDAIIGHQVRRVEVALPAGDRMGRRAVHRAGFRMEGLRRQALAHPDGEFEDVALYARLAGDIAYGPHAFSAVSNSVLPRTRAMAHTLFRNDAGAFLFCSVHYKDDYELPGGIVEVGEPPRVAARRETCEELGLDLEPGPLLCVDWMPPYLGWDDALAFLFDGGVLSPSQADSLSCLDEVTALRWLSLDEAEPHLLPHVAARLRLASSAAGTRYLEHGAPPQ